MAVRLVPGRGPVLIAEQSKYLPTAGRGYEFLDRYVQQVKKPAINSRAHQQILETVAKISDLEFSKNPELLKKCLDNGLVPAERVQRLMAFHEAYQAGRGSDWQAFTVYASHPELTSELTGALEPMMSTYRVWLKRTANGIIDSTSPKFDSFKSILEDPFLSNDLKNEFLAKIINTPQYQKKLKDPDSQRTQMAVALIKAGARPGNEPIPVDALYGNPALRDACAQAGIITKAEQVEYVAGHLGAEISESQENIQAEQQEEMRRLEAEFVRAMPVSWKTDPVMLQRAIDSAQLPISTTTGTTGSYFLSVSGKKAAVFKPMNQEPGAPGNTRMQVAGKQNIALRQSIKPGQGAGNEVLAYSIDR